MTDTKMSDDEAKVVEKIATDYLLKVAGSEEQAKVMMDKLIRVIQDDSAKLVHLGNILFLILVRAQGVVEVHTIGEEARPRDMAKDFLDLSKYLKNIGVTTAYTYAEDDKFKKLAKMVSLSVKEFDVKHENKNLRAYVVEL